MSRQGIIIVICLMLVSGVAGWWLGRVSADESDVGQPGAANLISVGFGAEQVWEPSMEAVAGLADCGPNRIDWRECVWDVMQRDGASRDAFAFFQLTDAFLTDLRGEGRVKIGSVLYRWRANENVQPALLGGDPAVVLPEDLARSVVEFSPGFQDLPARSPNVLFWAPGPQLESTEAAPDGSQRFTFRYRLLDGCHACPILGYARVEYGSAANGRFIGPPRLLGIVNP